MLTAAILAGLSLSQGWVAQAQPATDKSANYVPKKGLTLSLWAREPMVADPVAISFDDTGVLYVAETARRGTVDIDIRSHPDWILDDLSNQNLDDLRRFFRARMAPEKSSENARWLPDYNKDGSHDWRDLMGVKERVRRLEDPLHTGKATRSTIFAEGFNEEVNGVLAGVMPWGEDVFATVYPDLWRLRDPDHQGVAKTYESMFRGFGVHAAFDGHDLHGLTMGPDGKIYFSQGDNGFSVTNKEGRVLNYPNTGGVLRMNPDGSDLEVFAMGLRNVQEVAFDEYGNMFGVDNDGDIADERERFVYIAEGSDSGWRLHWQFKEQGWKRYTHMPNYNPWIDERMWVPFHPGQPAHITPPLSNYAVGPGSFKYNPGTAINDAYRRYFFLIQFPVQKVTAFQAKPKGAGFEMAGEHVVLSGMMASAVNFSPDGAVYVADWDGMWNPDGKGGIYRLDDESNAHSALRQEVQQLLLQGLGNRKSSNLVTLLGHADMRIRQRAQFELARRHESRLFLAVATDKTAPQLARVHALWGLGQLKEKLAPDALPFHDADFEIRAQAAKLAGDLHLTSAADILTQLINDPEPRVRFHAAMALGKAGNEASLSAVVQLLAANDNADAFIRHAGVYALAGIAKPSSLAALSSHPSPAVRIATVVALRRLHSAEVSVFLKDADRTVRLEAVRAIHDDQSIPELLPSLASLLDRGSEAEEAATRRAISAASRLGRAEDAARLLRYALDTAHSEPMRAEAILALSTWDRTPELDRVEGIVRRRQPKEPSVASLGRNAIRDNIQQLLQKASPSLSETIARCLTDESIDVKPDALQAIVRSDAQTPSARAQALNVLAKLHPAEAAPLIDEGLESKNPELRMNALGLIATGNQARFAEMLPKRFEQWTIPEQQNALFLASRMKNAVVDAFISEKNAELQNGKLPKELTLDVQQASIKRKLVSEKRAGEPGRSEGSDSSSSGKMTEALYGGDPRRGEDLFRNHVGAQCVRCHDAGGPGKQVGPVLQGVASRGTREYLLESLLDPSAKIAPGFETLTLTLANGDVVDGQKMNQTASQLTLRLTEGETRTFATNEIKSVSTSTVSPMPSMRDILSPFEIRDLVAYLSELK